MGIASSQFSVAAEVYASRTRRTRGNPKSVCEDFPGRRVVIAFRAYRFRNDSNAPVSSDQRNAVAKVPGWLRAPVVQIDTVAQGLDPQVMR